MPADTSKGPGAPSEHIAAAQGMAKAPGAATGAAAPAMGLSAAFKAALGARPPEPHLKLPRMLGKDAVSPAKADRGGKAPKAAPVRTSGSGPRTGHK